MKRNRIRAFLAMTLAASMMAAVVLPSVEANAQAALDGKTEASVLAQEMELTDEWNAWQEEWENSVKTDWTQISLTPGSDTSQLNFAWYSKTGDGVPKLKIGKGTAMRNAKIYTAVQTEVKDVDQKDITADASDDTYRSNKVTVTGLKENTTYYYSYQKDGKWTTPAAYKTGDTENFSFIFVGDPQIGSSNTAKAKKPEDIAKESFKKEQSDSVCSDAFNWSNTLEEAYAQTDGKASFVVSAGDQIQTNARKVKNYAVSEIEYSGYLSPDILKSLPVATTVGNHDADNPNYTYHFNTPNNSTLGSNGIVGGDYSFTYGNVLFLMLNTQDTKVSEHKTFIENAVKENPDCKWRIVTLHQDIYGSAEHSNEPEIANLRYQLVPVFQENDIDVVFSGHDHAYSRSKMLYLNDTKTVTYDDDAFSDLLEKDLDAGDTPASLTVAPANIKDDTTDQAEKEYLNYLTGIMDADAVETVKTEGDAVVNPEGILYLTADSASGSKFYDLVPRQQSYIESRWQGDAPTYTIVDVDDDTLSFNTYRTDTNEKIDDSFAITKVKVDKSELKNLVDNAKKKEVPAKDSYKAAGYQAFEKALKGAEAVLNDTKALNSEVEAAIQKLTSAKAALVKRSDIKTVSVSSVRSQVYTGKKITPSVTVKAKGSALKKNKDYTVSYSGNLDTGKATITIKGINDYTGTKTVHFNILPKQAALKSVKSTAKKSAAVSIVKSSGKVTGYQIQYATNSKFTKAKSVTTRNTAYTLKSLSSNKNYYVRVRAYKTVDGKNIYGAYSKALKVKTK